MRLRQEIIRMDNRTGWCGCSGLRWYVDVLRGGFIVKCVELFVYFIFLMLDIFCRCDFLLFCHWAYLFISEYFMFSCNFTIIMMIDGHIIFNSLIIRIIHRYIFQITTNIIILILPIIFINNFMYLWFFLCYCNHFLLIFFFLFQFPLQIMYPIYILFLFCFICINFINEFLLDLC